MFGKTSNFGTLSVPPSIYVALSTTTPNADETSPNVTEPVGNNYARVNVAAAGWNSATHAAPAVLSNNGAINFPTASGDWASAANMTYVVLFDALTSGNMLGFGALTQAKPVLNGDTASFASGALQITLQ
jgi:hypothetical protein